MSCDEQSVAVLVMCSERVDERSNNEDVARVGLKGASALLVVSTRLGEVKAVNRRGERLAVDKEAAAVVGACNVCGVEVNTWMASAWSAQFKTVRA